MKLVNFKLLILFIGFIVFGLPNTTNAQKNMLNAPKAAPVPDFSARLVNLESATKDPFRYDITLKNSTKGTIFYSLTTDLPLGWNANFKVGGSQVTGLQMEPNDTKSISLEVNAPSVADPKTYNIKVNAISPNDTLHLNLEAVVKGDYGLELSTPTGKLSENVTEGSSKTIELLVKNTGSLPLAGLQITAQAPAKWETNFDLSTIDNLKAGESKTIKATISVPNKTIAGDYMTSFNVRDDLANAKADFRITVQTSILTGWIGVVIILLAIGLIYYLIRKYGRR